MQTNFLIIILPREFYVEERIFCCYYIAKKYCQCFLNFIIREIIMLRLTKLRMWFKQEKLNSKTPLENLT